MDVPDLSDMLLSLSKFRDVAIVHKKMLMGQEDVEDSALTFITAKNIRISYKDIRMAGRAFEILDEITNNDDWQRL